MRFFKKFFFCFLIIAVFTPVYFAFSFESNSSNFEIHGSALEGFSQQSTSTNFIGRSAGGQNAIGASTSTKKIFSGILNWLFGIFTSQYEQIHYRWRNDDADESTATWAANEDAQLSNLPQGSTKRIRLEISNEGWSRGNAPQFRLEYAQATTCSSGFFTTVPTSATTEHWEMTNSSYLSDASSTTNIFGGLTDENAVFIAGQTKDTIGQTSAISLTSENFTELEYSIKATSNSVNGGHYCFRVSNAGSTSNMIFSKYPEVIVSASSLTLTISTTTLNLGVLTPNIPVYATSSIDVVTSGANSGFTIQIMKDDSSSTLDLITDANIDLPDYSAWSYSSPNSTTTPGNNFSFRIQQSGTDSNYSSDWWGINDSGGTAKYAGIPTISQQILNCNIGGNCNNGTTHTILKYRADSPLGQKVGNYSGSVTITSLVNP